MRTFGILGYPLTHSFSKKYFEGKFEREGITDAEFKVFAVPAIGDFAGVLASEINLRGFCITIPYKKDVLSYLDSLSDAVREMGACNCVRVRDGNLAGFNTDTIGFELSFAPLLQLHHDRALVLGTGGAAASVEFALCKLGIGFTSVSRSAGADRLTYDELSPEVMAVHSVIVNTTPLGMNPKADDAPAIPYELLTPRHYLFDVVYNPSLTKFLRLGQERGATIKNGQDMLEIQAEENWRIWNE